MDQISMPMRVLLIATLAFVAVWLVALRPKPSAEPAAPATPAAAQTTTPAQGSALPGSLGNSVDRAGAAKSQADAAAAERAARAEAAADPSPTPAARPKPAVAPKPAAARKRAASAGPVSSVARHLARGRVVVLLFYSSGSDDRLVRGEIAGVARRGGKVHVRTVPVRRLARYRDALQGAQVLQTPSIVMLRRGSDPVLLPGYTDRAEVDQITAALLRRR